MLNIIRAELYKIFKSKLWIVSLILAVVLSFILLGTAAGDKSDNKKELIRINSIYEKELGMSAQDIKLSKEDRIEINYWKINQTYLETDQEAPFSNTFQGAISGILSVKMNGLFIVVFVVLFAAQIAREFESGTIKFMMMNPYDKRQIVLGKYLATIISALLFIGIVFLLNVVFTYILLPQSSNYTYVVEQGDILKKNIYLFALYNNGLTLLYYLLYASFAYMLAIITRSSSISLSISLFLAMLGSQLSGMLNLPISISKFLFISIGDLAHLFNTVSFNEMYGISNMFSSVVIICYIIIFVAVSIFYFENKDI